MVHGVSLTQQVSTSTNNFKPKCCCNCNSTFFGDFAFIYY